MSRKFLLIGFNILAFISGFLAIRTLHLSRVLKLANETAAHSATELKKVRHDYETYRDAALSMHRAAVRHVGRDLLWPDLELVHGEAKPGNSDSYKLYLYLSEISCNVCQDELTAFAREFSTLYGKTNVRAVVFSTRKQYVYQYIRVNQVDFPVFFDRDEHFSKVNQIAQGPMALLVREGRILEAAYPLPGFPEWSEAFYQRCRELEP
ncbi:MAG: hypothetical protein QNK37_22660 [Acidobacteriota bacterium]|nr:hypothetical protein [Acidobacteriota bacterium]